MRILYRMYNNAMRILYKMYNNAMRILYKMYNNAMRILYKMYNKFSFYIFFFAPQRNIFHRCFELHLLHLDDERDLHRAAPRDVTLENMSS